MGVAVLSRAIVSPPWTTTYLVPLANEPPPKTLSVPPPPRPQTPSAVSPAPARAETGTERLVVPEPSRKKPVTPVSGEVEMLIVPGPTVLI